MFSGAQLSTEVFVMSLEFAVQGSHESQFLVSCLAWSRMEAFPRISLVLKWSPHTSVNVRAMEILFILIASISNYEHLCLSPKNNLINTSYQECVIVNIGGSGKYCHCSHMSSSPDSTVSHQTIKKETLLYTEALLLTVQHAERFICQYVGMSSLIVLKVNEREDISLLIQHWSSITGCIKANT